MNGALATRAPVAIAIAVGLALRIYFILATPFASTSVPGRLSSYNDEIAHVNYVVHVQQTGRLPGNVGSIEGRHALAEGYFENYQPPLYYAGAAVLGSVFGFESVADLGLFARFLNLAFFLLMIAIGIAAWREFNLDTLWLQAAIIFVALSGMVVRFSSTVTNDVLFWVLSGGMLWSAVRLRQSPSGTLMWLIFTGFAITSIYTKLTAVLLLPLPALLLLYHRDWKLVLRLFGAYALIILVTLPVWIRNVAEFGALLPLQAGFGAPEYAVPPPQLVSYAVRSFVFPWSEFWYGWIGLVLMLPAVVMMAASCMHRSISSLLRSHPIMIALLGITLLAYCWLNIQYRQAEARYLMAAWPVLVLLVSRPLRTQAATLWLLMATLLLPYGLFILPALGI